MRLKSSDLPNLLEEMIKEMVVFAPQREGAATNIKPLKSAGDIDLITIRPNTPAKEVIFPQTEKIYEIKDGKISETLEGKQAVLFGTRACDARGIQILDNFFLSRDRKDGGKQPWEDAYWTDRRAKITIVSIACERPVMTCACSSLGIHPASEAGSDVLLIPDGPFFEVMVVTPKGQKLVDKFKSYFEDGGNAKDAQERVKRTCEAMMHFKLDASKSGKFMKLYADQALWEKVSQGCISCGVCTFFCPTCHCFEMRDTKKAKESCDRLKCWDSCHFAVYSIEASGHNPRPDVAARYRNKLLDKFQYHITLYGEIACSGCGRCSDMCPAGISLADSLETLGGAL